MATVIQTQRKVISGLSAGGTLPVRNEFSFTQISFKGRATDIATITLMSNGSDVYEDGEEVITVDLASNKRTVRIANFSLDGIKITFSADGADPQVTVAQWA